jgi:hypothetical protein
MRAIFVLIISLFVSIPALAAEQCVTLDISSWTQEQKNMLEAISYHLVWEADNSMSAPSSVNRTSGEVCFTDPTVQISSILTEQIILAKYAEFKAQSEAATLSAQMEQQSYIQEIGNNDLCEGTLDEMIARAAAYVAAKRTLIDTQKTNFDAQVDAVSNFNTAAVKVALKQISANNATAYNQILDVIQVVVEKQAKCGLARARRSEF